MALTKITTEVIESGAITADKIATGALDTQVGTYLLANNFATTGDISTAISNLVDTSPTTLDTLNELAAALGDDPNFATTVTTALGTKLPLAGGTMTGALTVNARIDIGAPGVLSMGGTTVIDVSRNLLNVTSLGIGGSASYPFHINTSTPVYISQLVNTNTAAESYNVVRLAHAATSAVGYFGTGGATASNVSFRDAFVVGTQSNSDLVLNTNDAERVRVYANGDVNLGTGNNFKMGGTTVIDPSRNLTNIGSINSGISIIAPQSTGSEGGEIHIHGSADFTTGINLDHYGGIFRIHSDGTEWLRVRAEGVDSSGGEFKSAGTTVIDSSRNLVNIGNIDIFNTITTSADYTSWNQNAYYNYGWLSKTSASAARRLEFGVGGLYYSIDNTISAADEALTWVDLFKVKDNGNVGIGIDPSYPLEVASTNTMSIAYQRTGVSAKKWGFDSDNSATYWVNITDNQRPLTITHLNRVGINNELSPAYELDVAGDIQAQGAFRTEEVRHNIRPSLNLDFANSKELDSRITFYRDSIATYYDSKGVLRYANHNEPRFDHDPATGECKGLLLEEARTNSIGPSEAIHFALSPSFGGYWKPNYAKAPNGKMQASALYGDGSTSSARASSATSGANTFTFSVYAKDNGSGRFSFWTYSGGWVYTNTFTWEADGTLTASSMTNTTIEMVGDGWARLSATWTTAGNGSYQLSPGLYANWLQGDSTLFWGAQLEIGSSFATSYIPSEASFTSRASTATYYNENGTLVYAQANEPRYGYEYDGRKWVETGLLLEGEATNLAKYSHLQSGWGIPNSGYTYNTYVTAPDGSTIRAINNGTTYNLIRQAALFDNTITQTYTVSLWAKHISGSNVLWFDLGDSTPASASWTIGSEWARYTATVTYPANDTIHNFMNITMNPSSEIAIWGLQVETGSVATSYIPTQSSTVTRAADVVYSAAGTRAVDNAEITGANFSSWYNQGEGTLYSESLSFNKSWWDAIVLLDNNNIPNNSITNRDFIQQVYFSSGQGQIGAELAASGTQYAVNWDSNISRASFTKIASAMETDRFASSANGHAVATDTSIVIPTKINSLYLGKFYLSYAPFSGYIKKVSYYDQALTDAELQALTENN